MAHGHFHCTATYAVPQGPVLRRGVCFWALLLPFWNSYEFMNIGPEFSFCPSPTNYVAGSDWLFRFLCILLAVLKCIFPSTFQWSLGHISTKNQTQGLMIVATGLLLPSPSCFRNHCVFAEHQLVPVTLTTEIDWSHELALAIDC